MLAFFMISNGNKLEIITNWINFITSVHLSLCFELKLTFKFKHYKNTNISNFV